MWAGAWTVLRKELLEMTGDRRSFRGPLIQAAILLLMCGVFVPAKDASVWSDPASAALLFLFFPTLLATPMAADAFAGERERRTLETLLATPLSDDAIFVGKAAAPVLFAFVMAALMLLTAVVTVNVVQHPAPLFAPDWRLCLGLLWGALGGALLATAITVFISMRAATTIAAQKLANVTSFGMLLVASLLLQLLGVDFGFATLFVVDLLLTVAGVAALTAASDRFERARVFESLS